MMTYPKKLLICLNNKRFSCWMLELLDNIFGITNYALYSLLLTLIGGSLAWHPLCSLKVVFFLTFFTFFSWVFGEFQ